MGALLLGSVISALLPAVAVPAMADEGASPAMILALDAGLSAVTDRTARPKRTTDAGGSPVEGATTISDAPKIGNGRSTDSIVMGETLYYAVDLASGKDVTARLTVDATKAKGKATFVGGGIHISWVNAEGGLVEGGYTNSMEGRTTVTGVSIKAGESIASAPTAYLKIEMESWGPGSELPLVIEIQGAAGAAPAGGSQRPSSASPGGSTSPSADVPSEEAAPSGGGRSAEKEPVGEKEPVSEKEPVDDGDEGFSVIAVGAFGVVVLFLGLLIGAGIGYLGGFRSGRRPEDFSETTIPMSYPPSDPYGE
jgi:hypothetical protein